MSLIETITNLDKLVKLLYKTSAEIEISPWFLHRKDRNLMLGVSLP